MGKPKTETEALLDGAHVDSLEDMKEYFLGWRYFEVMGHYVVLVVGKDGEVSFSVDGVEEIGYVSAQAGASILRRLLKEWTSLKSEVEAVDDRLELYCNPVMSDGGLPFRTKAFAKAGFVPGAGGVFWLPNAYWEYVRVEEALAYQLALESEEQERLRLYEREDLDDC